MLNNRGNDKPTEERPEPKPNANNSANATSYSLLRRAKCADQVAWEQLTRIYSPTVYGWARQAGLQAQDAADIMQDVFMVLSSRLHQFERRSSGDSFRGWLYVITRNKVRDYFRANKQEKPAFGGTTAQEMWHALPEAPPEETSSAGQSEIQGIRHRALDLISGQFSPRTWQAFYRTAIQNDSPQDVAADLGITVWAVYKARNRILTKLRNEMEDLLS